MKRIIKKNQVIITSLVIMIVVAGYLNFTADESVTTPGNQTAQVQDGEDMLVDVDVAPEEDMDMVDAAAGAAGTENADGAQAAAGTEGTEGTENTQAAEAAGKEESAASDTAETENIDDVGSIGEAVLTSSQAAKGFSAAAKLNREQVRSQNKEMLMEIINDSAGDAALKAEAADSLKALAETAEKEQAAETLLEAKGFKNSVVSITEDGVDVVICLESLDDTQRTQIEDIVKRKAGVGAESIVITTLNE